MTSYLRLFVGLTSFISSLCLDHFSAMGPLGTFPSSVASTLAGFETLMSSDMATPLLCQECVDGKRREAERHDEGEHEPDSVDERAVLGELEAERLEGALESMA